MGVLSVNIRRAARFGIAVINEIFAYKIEHILDGAVTQTYQLKPAEISKPPIAGSFRWKINGEQSIIELARVGFIEIFRKRDLY